MVRKLFGTDGIRGTANSDPVTAEIAVAVAKAAGSCFTRGDHRHTVAIGKDTRLSCYLLEQALTAGFLAVGMDVILFGPVPTPAVAMLTRSMRADMGVMISASHNPYQDNGIKFFGPDGFKLNDALEARIESLVDDPSSIVLATPERLGRARRLDDAAGRYIEFVKNSFPRDLRLDGLRIAVDCANGAAYKIAPTILYELGAEVIPVAVQPDGFNINKNCGATAPQSLCETVVAQGADFGIALDGDADRLIMVDEKGQIIDGDQVMAVIARTLYQSGQLRGGRVVATVMSNMGLENYLKKMGVGLIRAFVGDRHVFEKMRESGANLGGEQSGHMILSDYATTGDGLIAALQVIAAILRDGRRASEVMQVFEQWPQILKNVPISCAPDVLLHAPEVTGAIDEGERRLGSCGRVLIRVSGTEPVVRVMAEGRERGDVESVVEHIVGAMKCVC